MPTALLKPELHAPSPRLRDRRDRVEATLDLAGHLPERERALVEQVFRRGASIREIARLTGTPPGTLGKRLRRIQSPLYLFLDRHADLLPAPERRTAEAIVFAGLSLRAAAAHNQTTLHTVRVHMRAVRALARV